MYSGFLFHHRSSNFFKWQKRTGIRPSNGLFLSPLTHWRKKLLILVAGGVHSWSTFFRVPWVSSQKARKPSGIGSKDLNYPRFGFLSFFINYFLFQNYPFAGGKSKTRHEFKNETVCVIHCLLGSSSKDVKETILRNVCFIVMHSFRFNSFYDLCYKNFTFIVFTYIDCVKGD